MIFYMIFYSSVAIEDKQQRSLIIEFMLMSAIIKGRAIEKILVVAVLIVLGGFFLLF